MNTIFKIYFQFSGRIPRSTYWLASIPVAVVALIADLCDEHSWSILLWLAIIWPSLAIATKRWHDRDKSGWWNLINFIPLVGGIWSLVECGFLPGTDGQNRFGQPNTALEPTATAP
ncbi:MAG: DUF805 domain-containing protein [Limisphaerales bacterium]